MTLARIICLSFIVVIGVALSTPSREFFLGSYSPDISAPTTTVSKRSLTKLILTKGRISCQVFPIQCPLKGVSGKLINIQKHGSFVAKDDIVIQFDTVPIIESIKKKRAEVHDLKVQVATHQYDYDIQLNKNEAEVSTTRYELKIARLTLKKYIDSDIKIQKLTQEGRIAEAKANLERRSQQLEKITQLVGKGFRTTKQLQEIRNLLRSSTDVLKQEQEQLRAMVDFEFRQKKYDLTSKVSEAESKEKLAVSNGEYLVSNLETRLVSSREKLDAAAKQLSSLESQLSHCEIRAEKSGVFARCRNQEGYYIEKNDSFVHKQNLFYFVDRRKLLVKFTIPNKKANLIKKDAALAVRVHGLPNETFFGKVTKMRPGMEGTDCEASIESIPEHIVLNPGMDVDVYIPSVQATDVISLPFMSVAKYEDQHYAFEKNGNRFVPIKVEIGNTGDSFTEIKSGLNLGSSVAIDADSFVKTLLMNEEQVDASSTGSENDSTDNSPDA